MKCEKCGAELYEGAKFCQNCGHEVTPPKTQTLECPKCGGVMTMDFDNPIKVCPFCGNRELIVESEMTTRQRVRNKTIRNISNDIRATGKEFIESRERIKREKEKNDMKVLLGMAIFLILIILFSFIMSIFGQ
ncbi:zinc ribbon domain-containing protein [Blautia obeum]|uniref:Zinc-ribbon domain-containing protein n=1 Tax=Blautia obeum TaxID=40520 RepID=A0A414W5R5_9FIRM|nr:zinc ribbon domain-containing protein [Blautia obeum]RHH21115.1 zinc-ribbon domain-containing protein [Blautia obeum]